MVVMLMILMIVLHNVQLLVFQAMKPVGLSIATAYPKILTAFTVKMITFALGDQNVWIIAQTSQPKYPQKTGIEDVDCREKPPVILGGLWGYVSLL